MSGVSLYLMRIMVSRSRRHICNTQNHYNLLYREDDRELIPICKQILENVQILIEYLHIFG